MGWHDIRLSEVAAQLKTDTAVGLTSAAVRARAKKYGRNKHEPALPTKENSILKAVLWPGTLLFVAGAVFCAIADKSWIWAAVVIAIALADLAFRLARNNRIRQVHALLSGSIGRRASVTRDGRRLEVLAEFLVPGDLISVTAGDVIPADARLVTETGLFCDESTLFGIGRLSKKDFLAVVHEDDPIDVRANMIYSGCGVTDGSATAIVTMTGKRTENARLRSRTVLTPEGRSPLEKNFYKSQITLAISAAVFGAAALILPRFFPNALSYESAFSTVLLAIGMVIGFEPVAEMRTGLSNEAVQLCENGMTFRNPANIEKSADLSMVCSDIDVLYAKKRMKVVMVWTQLGVNPYDPDDEDQAAVLRLAALGLGCEFDGDNVPVYRGRDAKTTAILAAVEENGGLFRLFTDFNRVLGTGDSEITAAAILYGKVKLTVAVGSANVLLIHCDEPILDARQAVLKMQNGAAEVVAVAVKKLHSESADGFMIAGMIAVQNEFPVGLPQYCENLYHNGITPIILTAKSKNVTEAYARALGVLCEGEKVAEAGEAKTSDPTVRAYADCSVRDCLKIIKEYRIHGETVAVIASECTQNNLLDASDLGVAAADACDMVRQKAGLTLSADTNYEFLNVVRKSRRCIHALKNSVLFGVMSTGAIFVSLITLFLAGRTAFDAAAALLIFAAVKFFFIPDIRRQDFQRNNKSGNTIVNPLGGGGENPGAGNNPGAGYSRSAGMHALFVSIYIIASSIGCSFLGIGTEKTGSFIALACGICIAALCFSDERTLFKSSILSNKWLIARVGMAFLAYALIGLLLLETGAAYPFAGLVAAVGVFPFSEIVKLVFKVEKRDNEANG